MRILTVIYEFPPIGGGGGRAAYDICKELAARGHDVSVLTAHMQGLPFQNNEDGIHVTRISSLRREPFRATFFTMLAYVLAGLWAGLRLIYIHRPDIIHTHFAVPSGALAWTLSVLTGIPYVLTAHLGDVPGGVPEKTGKWFRWLEPFTKPIWRRAKKVVAVSEFTRQLALQHYAVEVQVVPNGVDALHLVPVEVKLNKRPHLVFAGRFVYQKNPLAIVKILSHLKDLDWSCSMLGDGPMFEEVKKEIEKYDMSARFNLPGWVTPEDVLDQFSKGDILFMPSFSEGLPVVGVQALAKGLALVTSRIGGFLDLVDHEENGYLVEVHDELAFSQALRKLISSPEVLLQFRKASVKKSRDFDIQKVVDKYQQIFQSVLNEG
ncbi:MAG: glycosyltransferase family 4 protein [Anaerolineales bacterium]|nr:glycosyltransferase family 4 protein [Anaerolineales bacterium]